MENSETSEWQWQSRSCGLSDIAEQQPSVAAASIDQDLCRINSAVGKLLGY